MPYQRGEAAPGRTASLRQRRLRGPLSSLTNLHDEQLRASDSLSGGFASSEAIDQALALLGGQAYDLGHRWSRTRAGERGGARYRVAVSPGSVRLRALDAPEGWEPVPEQESPSVLVDENPERTRHAMAVEHEPTPCRWWSDLSRRRMVRALATVDWGPVVLARGCRPAMVTLTYPGDWMAVAPDSATVKRHWDRLLKRLRRLFESNGLDAPAGVWKLEFQRRGAPHLHIYMPVPVAAVSCRVGRGRSAAAREVRFAEWVSSAWASIVGAEGEELERHRRAGTAVDFAEGARMSDPRRLAVYFTRHNAKGSRGKQYQHRVPDEWVTAGRWWGTFGVARLERDVEVTAEELKDARRFLRRWVESQQVHGAPRAVPVEVARGKGRRWVRRRYRLKSLHGSRGGFVLANDGPGLAAALARYLDFERARRSGQVEDRDGFLP